MSDDIETQIDPERGRVRVHAADLHPPESIPLTPNRPDVGRARVPARERFAQRFEARYEARGVIGAGGMGEVRLARDRTIGREVAMKVIRDGRGPVGRGGDWRFIREARVQGQLEHPAIAPVYDLGLDPGGQLYFTMKRVRGMSLGTLIERLAADDVETRQRWSERRRLTLFSQLCMAVDYIHSRGVVHRDLKPDNVMVGSFGEVYVLDWGLAKLLDEPDEEEPDEVSEVAPPILDASNAQLTMAGSVMGTPGFMAPEQLRNDLGEVGPRADIYALGLMLHELLTTTRVHGGTVPLHRILSTLKLDGVPPLDTEVVPPELAGLIHQATRLKPEARLESARSLSDGIEAYLDGDRDAEQRRQLAERHVTGAREAFERSLAGGSAEAEARAKAMRHVTVALGLEPDNDDALRTLVDLLTNPPRDVPDEALEGARQSFVRRRRLIFIAACLAFLAYTFYLPFPFWMGLESPIALGVLAASIGSCAAIAAYTVVTRAYESDRPAWFMLLMPYVTASVSSVLLGPLILVPILVLINNHVVLTAYSKRRWIAVALSVLAMAVPLALQLVGLIPPFYTVADNHLVVSPIMVSFPELPTMTFLFVVQVAIIVSASILVARLRDDYERAEETIQIQKWQLEQIIPEPTQSMTTRVSAGTAKRVA